MPYFVSAVVCCSLAQEFLDDNGDDDYNTPPEDSSIYNLSQELSYLMQPVCGWSLSIRPIRAAAGQAPFASLCSAPPPHAWEAIRNRFKI